MIAHGHGLGESLVFEDGTGAGPGSGPSECH